MSGMRRALLRATDRSASQCAHVAAAEAVQDLPPGTAPCDDAGLVQQAELLARCRLRKRGRRGERANRELAVVEQLGHEPKSTAIAEQSARSSEPLELALIDPPRVTFHVHVCASVDTWRDVSRANL